MDGWCFKTDEFPRFSSPPGPAQAGRSPQTNKSLPPQTQVCYIHNPSGQKNKTKKC